MADEPLNNRLDALLTVRGAFGSASVVVTVATMSLVASGCAGDIQANSPPRTTTAAEETTGTSSGKPPGTVAPSTLPEAPASLARLAGGLIVTGVDRSAPTSPTLVRLAQAGEIGGVIVIDTSARDVIPVLKPLQAAAARGGNPRLIVAVDQEGGPVRRFQDLGPTSSHAELGAQPISAVYATALKAGCALARRGVTLDLAPVADIASRRDGFIARSGRSFGPSARQASPRVEAFVKGLGGGGVGATLKHFPGLGTGVATTDATLAEALPDPGDTSPFLAGIRAGAAAVMISSASYTDGPFRSQLPAFVNTTTTGWLRSRGFDGVLITDDLSTDAIRNDARLPDPAVQAVKAGIDILLFVDATGKDAQHATAALVAAVRDGRLTRERLQESWSRRQRLGAQTTALGEHNACG